MEKASHSYSTMSKGAIRKYAKRSFLMWLIFLPLVFVIFVPVMYMVTMAFTTEANQFVVPIHWIPKPPTLNNFIRIFADPLTPLARWFGNSLLVASVGTVINLTVSSLSGYAFARLEFPGKNLLFSLLLFSLMIPAAITLIPSFLLLRDLKLLDSYHAIWWPAAASVTGIFLLRQHFYSIPVEMEDAARIDGAGRFQIFWQVCLPLVTNSLAALAIFSFLGLWNDLFWPLIVLTKQITLTLPIGLVVLQQGSYIQRGLAYAGSFVATTPVLIFYAIFQRKIIAGITTAGMAGQ
jgi:multiple sugar transport system permease protein